jgi:hypothetical protein
MANDWIARQQAKEGFFFKLGLLLAPLKDMVDNQEPCAQSTRTKRMAQYCASFEALIREFQEFCRAEPGHDYQAQGIKFMNALILLRHTMVEGRPMGEVLCECEQKAMSAIAEVPVLGDALILPAETPFTAYCVLRDICLAARDRIILVDPYVDDTLFHRYLRDVQAGVHVTLVTAEPRPGQTADERRYQTFLDVSALYARERGEKLYLLAVSDALHDRYLCADTDLWQLGGSVKDAAHKKGFTITRIEATRERMAALEQLIERARLVLGKRREESGQATGTIP